LSSISRNWWCSRLAASSGRPAARVTGRTSWLAEGRCRGCANRSGRGCACPDFTSSSALQTSATPHSTTAACGTLRDPSFLHDLQQGGLGCLHKLPTFPQSRPFRQFNILQAGRLSHLGVCGWCRQAPHFYPPPNNCPHVCPACQPDPN